MTRVAITVALVHGGIAIACAATLAITAEPTALKPLKFAITIALLLASVHVVLGHLALDPRAKSAIAWTLSATMLVEMVAIAGQALRGSTSHYNVATPFDAFVWGAMALAIVTALGTLLVLAWLATSRTLAFSPLVALAVRIGLWLMLLVAVSGFAMAARSSHGVGAGDLRVAHFFAVHGLQALPIATIVLERFVDARPLRHGLFAIGASVWIALAIGTLAHALARDGGPRVP